MFTVRYCSHASNKSVYAQMKDVITKGFQCDSYSPSLDVSLPLYSLAVRGPPVCEYNTVEFLVVAVAACLSDRTHVIKAAGKTGT